MPQEQSPEQPRAHTLAAQGLVNRLIRTLLRTPLVCRGIGRRLIELHVTGRRTGRSYEIPVAYTPHEGDLLIGTPFAWAKNLRTGEPIDVLHKGRLRTADVTVIADEPGVVEHYSLLAADNRAFAKFNKIGFTDSGEPDPDDLHQAWASGARAIRLTLR